MAAALRQDGQAVRLCLGRQAEVLEGAFTGEAVPLIPLETRVSGWAIGSLGPKISSQGDKACGMQGSWGQATAPHACAGACDNFRCTLSRSSCAAVVRAAAGAHLGSMPPSVSRAACPCR